MYLILCACFLYMCVGGKLKDLFIRSQSWKMRNGFFMMLLQLPLRHMYVSLFMLILAVLNREFDVNLKIIRFIKITQL